jgi:tRNA A-37 threonylcarbamoyl transferase component Bud32
MSILQSITIIVEKLEKIQLPDYSGESADNYVQLYDDFKSQQLSRAFAILHNAFNSLFGQMNSSLPTGEDTGYFHADPSRNLLQVIDVYETLSRELTNTEFAFKLIDSYQDRINLCKNFLSQRWGSTIPANTDKLNLIYIRPIFTSEKHVIVQNYHYERKMIGEGSYAHVYKYKDEFYNKFFAVKKAKKDLEEKELERFKQEYEVMSQMKSPYIVEVYHYDTDENEYIFEFMDSTLGDFIKKNANKLTKQDRKNIGRQILSGIEYTHSKGCLHRDLSPTNILVKEYEDKVVVKLSDFGLVKTHESDLTSTKTEFKGSFNNPDLKFRGFKEYNLQDEIYSLTYLLFFVLTGRRNLDSIKEPLLKQFVFKGMEDKSDSRFATIEALKKAFFYL